MFPSQDLPANANDNNSGSNESTDINEKRILLKPLISLIFILLIIAVAIMLGLLSVFIPKSTVIPTMETVVLTLVLPITENSSKVLSLNDNPLMANHYLNGAQRYVLKNCLQRELNSDNRTKSMIILSVNNARAQYSGNSSTKIRQLRKRRQASSLADQVALNVSIQCYPFISTIDCQQIIELVIDNGESLKCTLADEIITASIASTTTKPAIDNTQTWRQVGELFLAFGLTSLIGLERHLRGKSAGVRTHSIVGTTSALIMLVSKYGFSDVLYQGMVTLDPSRIAAQIVSGISFLGTGLIITRHKAVRGLTTAASVWTAAAIGMAAGSGLWLISLVVAGLYFVIFFGFSPLENRIPVMDERSSFHLNVNADDGNESDDSNQSV